MNSHAILREKRVKYNALGAALEYAARGFPIIPLSTESRYPAERLGIKDASTDPQKIKTMWDLLPLAMIGMPTGKASGVAAIQVDPTRCDNPYEIKDVPTVIEPDDVRSHLIPWTPKLKYSLNRIQHGVTVRANGGWIVLPGSTDMFSCKYSWADPARSI